MNKNLKILLILVAVAAAAYFVISRKPWTTLKPELKDFAIKDTASVTRFFLADKRGNSVQVAKNENGVWMVNNMYKADVAKVNLLLATMHDVTVRNPISENEFNTVIASLATDGVKAEFYKGDKIIKTIYVGSASADQAGTFMLVEGSSAPFVTHIEGFVGYLSPRFYTYPIKWKDKEVFDMGPEDISLISVGYGDNESFVIDNENSLHPVLKSVTPEVKEVATDLNFVKYYVAGFDNLFFEGYDETMPAAKADSIRQSDPFCVIEVRKKDGSTTRLVVHYKEVGDHTKILYDEHGKLLKHDTEKYYGFINDEKDVVYLQDYNFRRIFKKLGDFKAHKPAGNP
jgi:hypothetical protein